jgi:hypothetical protein
MSWFSTVLKVAQVAGQILAELPVEAEGGTAKQSGPYMPGGIEAGWDATTSSPYIKNVTSGPVAVNFVLSPPVDSVVSESSYLVEMDKHGQGFDPQPELDFYRNGDLMVFDASPQPVPQNGVSRLIQFSAALFIGAAAARIAPGFRVGVRRAPNPEIYFEKEQSAGTVEKINAQLTIPGSSFTVTVGEDKKAMLAETEIKFPLPPDVDLSPGAQATGTIVVDDATYQQMILESRARVRMIG